MSYVVRVQHREAHPPAAVIDKIIDFINGLRNYNKVPDKQPARTIDPLPGTNKPKADFQMPTTASSWKGIVIHHSESVDHPNANDWESIRHYHTSWRVDREIVSEATWKERKASGKGTKFEKPWKAIGYHLGLERDGGKLCVRIGRGWDIAGAHAGLPSTNEYNEEYLGMCWVGDFDKTPPDQEMWAMGLAVLRTVMDRFGIPTANIIGHREVYDRAGVPREKTCPGSAFNLDTLRSEL